MSSPLPTVALPSAYHVCDMRTPRDNPSTGRPVSITYHLHPFPYSADE